MKAMTKRGNQIFIQKYCPYLGYNRRFIEEEKDGENRIDVRQRQAGSYHPGSRGVSS